MKGTNVEPYKFGGILGIAIKPLSGQEGLKKTIEVKQSGIHSYANDKRKYFHLFYQESFQVNKFVFSFKSNQARSINSSSQ